MRCGLQANMLANYVQVGQRVKVLDGIYAGDTGMVLALEERESGPVAVVAANGGRKEIEVRQSQIKHSSDKGMSLESVNGCELYDMAMFGYNQYGVVVRIGRDIVEVSCSSSSSSSSSSTTTSRSCCSSSKQGGDGNGIICLSIYAGAGHIRLGAKHGSSGYCEESHECPDYY